MKNKLLQYKVTLMKSSQKINQRQVWEKAKRELSFEAYSELLIFLSKQNQYEDILNLEDSVHEVKDLTSPKRDLIMSKGSKEKDILNNLLGVLAYLNLSSNKLSEFNRLKNSFENYILTNSISKSTRILNKIGQEFGISFWIIESTFLNNNYKDVILAEKYFQNIKEQCPSVFLKEFIRCIHKRISNLIKFDEAKRFIENKEEKIKTLCQQGVYSLEEYTYFVFYNSYNQNSNVLGQIELLLSFCNFLSLVDLYNLVDRLVGIFLTDQSVSNFSKEILIKAIKELKFGLSCTPTLGVSLAKSLKDNPLTSSMYTIFKLFHEDYNQCYLESIKSLAMTPNEFDLIMITCQLKILLSKETDIILTDKGLLFELQNVLIGLLKKDIHYNQFVTFENKCAKLLYQLHNMSIFFAFRNVYLNNYSDEQGEINSEYSYIFSKYHNVKSGFSSSNVNYVDNKCLYVVDWLKNCKVIENLKYDKISLLVKHLDTLTLDELKLITDNGYEELSIKQNLIVKNVACEAYFDKLVEANKYLDAIIFYVNCSFKSKTIVKSFKLKNLNRNLNRKIVEGFYGELEFCIFADLIDLKGSSSLGFNYYACNSLESILQKNHLRLPSDLDVPVGQEKLYSYLFRHVCNERLLASYIKFNLESFNYFKFDEVFILKERKKLLELSLRLDNECEKNQIQTQLDSLNERIMHLQILLPTEAEIDTHHISKGCFRELEDVRLLMQLYNVLLDLRIRNVPLEGEGYLFLKELLINYKKFYFSLLDEQIGINVRHGFFKDEILRFLKKHGILVLKKEEKDCNSESYDEFLRRKQNQLKKNNRFDLINSIEEIWDFSIQIYKFIDFELNHMKIISVSSRSDGEAFKIYIDEKRLYTIAEKIFSLTNPYQIQKVLWEEFDAIAEIVFANIRNYINEKVFVGLSEFCCKAMTIYGLGSVIEDKEIKSLTDSISKWFSFYDDGNKQCSVALYLKELKRKYGLLELIPVSSNAKTSLTLEQIHIIDIILKNLIFNAIGHAALEEDKLNISCQYFISSNEVVLIMKNSLGGINIEKLKKDISILEDCVQKRKIDRSFDKFLTGNGYKYIVQELSSDLVENNSWNIIFNKNVLPTQFEVKVNFNWKRREDV